MSVMVHIITTYAPCFHLAIIRWRSALWSSVKHARTEADAADPGADAVL